MEAVMIITDVAIYKIFSDTLFFLEFFVFSEDFISTYLPI